LTGRGQSGNLQPSCELTSGRTKFAPENRQGGGSAAPESLAVALSYQHYRMIRANTARYVRADASQSLAANAPEPQFMSVKASPVIVLVCLTPDPHEPVIGRHDDS
jgi:hypothetical protein